MGRLWVAAAAGLGVQGHTAAAAGAGVPCCVGLVPAVNDSADLVRRRAEVAPAAAEPRSPHTAVAAVAAVHSPAAAAASLGNRCTAAQVHRTAARRTVAARTAVLAAQHVGWVELLGSVGVAAAPSCGCTAHTSTPSLAPTCAHPAPTDRESSPVGGTQQRPRPVGSHLSGRQQHAPSHC